MLRFNLDKTLEVAGIGRRKLSEYNPLKIHQKGSHTKALFALGLVCFFWGTTWLASKEGVKHMPALQLVGIRQLIGGFIYVLWFSAQGNQWPRGKEWWSIIVLSFLNFILANGLSTWGVKFISAGLGSIIGAIFPLWLVVIGLFGNREKIPAKAIIGLVLGFGGVCVIFYEHLFDFRIPDFRFGIMISLIATLAWAFGTLYTKKHAVSYNPYFSLGLQMVISGIVITTGTYVSGEVIPLGHIPWQSWAAIAYLVIFGSVISFVAYLYALQRLPTGLTSIYAYINPVVAVTLGSLIFGEKLTVFISAGGAIAIFGVFLVNRAYKLK